MLLCYNVLLVYIKAAAMILFRSLLFPARLSISLTLPCTYTSWSLVSQLRLYYSKNCVNRISVAHYSASKLKANKYGISESAGSNKEEIIKRLNFKNLEDAMPFYELSSKTLTHICIVTENDEKNGFCKNRLYYLSSKINCPPSVLSPKLVKRTFIYSLSFDWLDNSLNVLLDMGVTGDRILRDLWVLKYHSDTIRNRLERVKSMGIDIFYPWMVRCTEEVLNRYINISQETKTILAETKTIQAYIANRLNIDPKDVEQMYNVLPALKTIRVTKRLRFSEEAKRFAELGTHLVMTSVLQRSMAYGRCLPSCVKHFLDFLIEAGFDVEEIASKPRVFSASQKTVEQRLIKLRALGLTDINLNVLCRSKKSFNKYVECITTANN